MGLFVVIILACILFAISSAIPSINNGAAKENGNDIGFGVILLIIAIVLFILLANIEVYPTCTLDGLL